MAKKSSAKKTVSKVVNKIVNSSNIWKAVSAVSKAVSTIKNGWSTKTVANTPSRTVAKAIVPSSANKNIKTAYIWWIKWIGGVWSKIWWTWSTIWWSAWWWATKVMIDANKAIWRSIWNFAKSSVASLNRPSRWKYSYIWWIEGIWWVWSWIWWIPSIWGGAWWWSTRVENPTWWSNTPNSNTTQQWWNTWQSNYNQTSEWVSSALEWDLVPDTENPQGINEWTDQWTWTSTQWWWWQDSMAWPQGQHNQWVGGMSSISSRSNAYATRKNTSIIWPWVLWWQIGWQYGIIQQWQPWSWMPWNVNIWWMAWIWSPFGTWWVVDKNNANNEQLMSKIGDINSINPDLNKVFNYSPDSPFWNKFWQEAVSVEDQYPWFMNDRNKVISSYLLLNHPDMKYMSEWARKLLITDEIIKRQEKWIDENISWWYENTVTNINNLINRELPAPTKDDYCNILLNWWDTTYIDKKDPVYTSAKRRVDDINKYTTSNVETLKWYMRDWSLVQWSQIWNDLVSNGLWWLLDQASLAIDEENSSSITNYVMDSVYDYDPNLALSTQSSPYWSFKSYELAITNKLIATMTWDKLPTLASYLASVDEVQDAKKASRATEKEILALETKISEFGDNIKETIVERWWEATWDPFLDIYISEKTKPFIKEMKVLQDKYRNEIAVLSDATENARAEFEVKEYNKNMEIDAYKMILDKLNQQYERNRQEYTYNKNYALDREQLELSKLNSDRDYQLSLAKLNQPVEIWWSMYTYNSSTKTYEKVNMQNNIQASWNLVSLQLQNPQGKSLARTVDSVAAPSLQKALSAMNKAWITPVIGETYRTRDRQTQLYNDYVSGKWWKANKPWTSLHEKWLAIDIYADGKYNKPTPQQVAIMNANGWYQTAWLGDTWHFEYKWTGNTWVSNLYQWIYNSTMWAKDIFDSKTLSSYWLESWSRSGIIRSLSSWMASSYLNSSSSNEEIDAVVSSLATAFEGEITLSDLWSALASNVGTNKTIEYMSKNNFWDGIVDDSTPEEIEQANVDVAQWLLDIINNKQINKDNLKEILRRTFSRKRTRQILNLMDL